MFDQIDQSPHSHAFNTENVVPVSGIAPATFIISLDFELRWGTRDQDVPASATQLLNARDVVLRLLEMFERKHVAATWATVGFLFAESREELDHFAPGFLPTYENSRLFPYGEKVGKNEQDDPLHFAPSLVRSIQRCPRQELASHTFSHYYCLEAGQTPEQFEADLQSACQIAAARGAALRSIVFPRNQVNPEHFDALRRSGITNFRGTAQSFLHTASSFAEQRVPYKRALRLVDAYVPIFGSDVAPAPIEITPGLFELKASRYFRPYTPALSSLADRAIQRIKHGMKTAAQNGCVYHLWFHPEDFGLCPDENLMLLHSVLEFYEILRDQYGMQSLTMSDSVESASPRTLLRQPGTLVGSLA